MDHMHLVLPTSVAPIRIMLDEPLSDEDLLWMCEQNEVFHVEREPDGSLLARKIGGWQSGIIGAHLCGELGNWAEKDGRGRAYSYKLDLHARETNGWYIDMSLRHIAGWFSCDSCTHRYATVDDGAWKPCECDFCHERQEKLFSEVRNALLESAPSRLTAYRSWCEELNADASEERMSRDYQLRQNNLSKDLRGVLALKPKDGQDFLACITEYSGNHKFGPRKLVPSKIEEEAITNGVIYRWAEPRDCERYVNLLSVSSFLIHYGYRGKTDTKESVIEDLLFGKDAVARLAPTRSAVRFRGTDSIFGIFGPQELDSLCDAHVYSDRSLSYKLNPHFLNKTQTQVESDISHSPSVPRAATNHLSHRRLFNSEVERGAYSKLMGYQEVERIVVPNRVFYQLIERGALSDLQARYYAERESDWRYIRTCELDMVIYDKQGNLIGVEEVQRGQHHNDPEWIRKDALKREALEQANIPFWESF